MENYLKIFKDNDEYNVCEEKPVYPHLVDSVVIKDANENIKSYLTFTSLEDNNTFYFKAKQSMFGDVTILTISASTDGGNTWFEKKSSSGGSGTSIATISKGQTLILKGLNKDYGRGNSTTNNFNSSKKFEVSGNLLSISFGDDFGTSYNGFYTYAYFKLFGGCTGLTSAENLYLHKPVGYYHYGFMFEDCTNLITAPSTFPNEVSYNAFTCMFRGCTNLTKPPKLPATVLAEQCYYSLFAGCTSLIEAPLLPANKLLKESYRNMFYGCSGLKYIKMMATDVSGQDCLNNWVYGVSSTGTFIKNSAATWNVTGNSGIPNGWTVQTASS